MSIVRIMIAVVFAGVIGTLANSAVVAALTPNAFVSLALSPGRLTVAVVVAALLPVAFTLLSRWPAVVTSVVLLTVVPSVLAKTVFGVGASWDFVLMVNAVYAVAAILAYALIARVLGSAGTA